MFSVHPVTRHVYRLPTPFPPDHQQQTRTTDRTTDQQQQTVQQTRNNRPYNNRNNRPTTTDSTTSHHFKKIALVIRYEFYGRSLFVIAGFEVFLLSLAPTEQKRDLRNQFPSCYGKQTRRLTSTESTRLVGDGKKGGKRGMKVGEEGDYIPIATLSPPE